MNRNECNITKGKERKKEGKEEENKTLSLIVSFVTNYSKT